MPVIGNESVILQKRGNGRASGKCDGTEPGPGHRPAVEHLGARRRGGACRDPRRAARRRDARGAHADASVRAGQRRACASGPTRGAPGFRRRVGRRVRQGAHGRTNVLALDAGPAELLADDRPDIAIARKPTHVLWAARQRVAVAQRAGEAAPRREHRRALEGRVMVGQQEGRHELQTDAHGPRRTSGNPLLPPPQFSGSRSRPTVSATATSGHAELGPGRNGAERHVWDIHLTGVEWLPNNAQQPATKPTRRAACTGSEMPKLAIGSIDADQDLED
jgi:hypothetical protein